MITMPPEVEFDVPATAKLTSGPMCYAPAMLIAEKHPLTGEAHDGEHAASVITATIDEAARIIDYAYEWVAEGQRMRLMGRFLNAQHCECGTGLTDIQCVWCRLNIAVIGLVENTKVLSEMERGFNNLLDLAELRASEGLPLDYWVDEDYSTRDLSLVLFSVLPVWVPTVCFSWTRAALHSRFTDPLGSLPYHNGENLSVAHLSTDDIGLILDDLGRWLSAERLRWEARREELKVTGRIDILGDTNWSQWSQSATANNQCRQ